jgi:hypothetical protein
VQVKVTVTGELFQPLELGAGLKAATMPGGVPTVNGNPLLGTPFTVTTTFPVVAPAGTGKLMLVALQLPGVAVVPLNVTVLLP